MRVKRAPQGFTIVETLLVLAVSSALFVSVVFMLSGRRGHTEFAQSVQDIKSQIQQVINDVSSGYYANTNDFTCTDPANGLGKATSLPPMLAPGTGNQGSNTGCVFIGKVMQFGVSGTDPEQFYVYNAVGVQHVINEDAKNNDNVDIRENVQLDANGHYTNARPVVSLPGGINAPRVGRLQYGLTTLDHGMYYGLPHVEVGTVAFVKSLDNYGINGTIDSGSAQVNVIPINGTALRTTATTAVNAININDHTNNPNMGLADGPVNPSTGVSICFVSASSNQSGLIKIGGGNRQLSVTLSIKDNQTCS